MKTEVLKAEDYLCLTENGIDIDLGKIDFKVLSINCEDLSRYRKALRVKIRAMLKQNDMGALQSYSNLLFSLAHFCKYLYGFHSCNSNVEPWQQRQALDLQKRFDITNYSLYDGHNWMSYDDIEMVDGIQDRKPFLTLKDKAHFDKLF